MSTKLTLKKINFMLAKVLQEQKALNSCNRNTFIPRVYFDNEPTRVTCVPYNAVHPVAQD